MENTANGIAALVQVHEKYAGGKKEILFTDDNLYIMQREGTSDLPGLVFVLNNHGDGWKGKGASTRWPNTSFTAVAWNGKDNPPMPEDKLTDENGYAEFWAPPRGYAVYRTIMKS
jgi:alpha-amylase